MHQLFVLIAVLAASAAAVDLPANIKRCKIDSHLDECVIQQSKSVLKILAEGDPKYNAPPLNPLKIEKIVFKEGDGKSAYLDMTLTNCDVYGCDNAELLKSNMDMKKMFWRWNIRMRPLIILADYEVKGQFLTVPIVGKGRCNITIEETNFEIAFPYTLVKKNGKDYIKIGKNQNKYTAERTHFKLENLFNGDKTLGEAVNNMLNDNWKVMVDQFAPAIGDALTSVTMGGLKAVTRKIPYDELFIF